jgi:hypothetical protein
MTGLRDACDKIIQDIAACQNQCSSDFIVTQLNSIMTIARSMTIGQRLSDLSGLQSAYDALYGSQAAYLNLIKDLQNIQQYMNAFPSGGTHDAFVGIFGDGVQGSGNYG